MLDQLEEDQGLWNRVFQKVQQEVTKMHEISIIYPMEHVTFVITTIVILKKSCTIKKCVYFNWVDEAIICDNYLIPYMEHLLRRVAIKETYNLINQFTGCDQVIFEDTRLI